MSADTTYTNPILPGFHPDPSICRVGEDYYLITSTFEYFPGIPIYHSRDLIHWQQIGHALDRPSQLNLDGIVSSMGVYAPTIRHHDGMFYIINTLVKSDSRSNFIVTTTDPAGDWSEPLWLDDAPGIDPSLFFDDDGRAWYVGNRVPPQGERFRSHREIWLRELDLDAMQLTGETYILWDGALRDAVHAEAPHIYKKDGFYYLMIAEGGTFHDHAVTIARSELITGPYVGNVRNPILTHRHLGKSFPIVATGHADLVETQNGEWYMVALACRPYDGYFYNLGRETFMMPVIWEDGWPVVSPGTGKIEFSYPQPDLPQQRPVIISACDHFDTSSLGTQWYVVRTPREIWWNLSARPGWLRLSLRPEALYDVANPSFVCRRQQHIDFTAQTMMEFVPAKVGEVAGIALRQHDMSHTRCEYGMGENGETLLRLVRRVDDKDYEITRLSLSAPRLYLRVEAVGQRYSFYYALKSGAWEVLALDVDGRNLSSTMTGGFTGVMVGMYASSQGIESDNHADFNCFEYLAIER